MKKSFFAFLIVLFAILACSPSSTPPQTEPVNVSTIVAATMQALTASAPPTPGGIQVSFQNVSFVIPNGLASGAEGKVIPAANEDQGGPWGVAPEHIGFTLNNYPLSNGNASIEGIYIYPAQEYSAANSWASASILRLKNILATPAAPLTNDNLPSVPYLGAAAQQYAAQAKLLNFNGGSGVRMVSQYGQFPGPITKNNSIFHYEGLTSDGKYVVAAVFSVILPLQSTSENPSADGITFPNDPMGDSAALRSYYEAIKNKLNDAGADTFQPSLTQLDELIQSITVISK